MAQLCLPLAWPRAPPLTRRLGRGGSRASPGAPQEFFVTVLGLVGGAPGGQTPGVADAAGACRVFHTKCFSQSVSVWASVWGVMAAFARRVGSGGRSKRLVSVYVPL